MSTASWPRWVTCLSVRVSPPGRGNPAGSCAGVIGRPRGDLPQPGKRRQTARGGGVGGLKFGHWPCFQLSARRLSGSLASHLEEGGGTLLFPLTARFSHDRFFSSHI